METEGKSLRQMYEEAKAQPTAVELFMREVADDLGYTRASVRAWLSGCQTPGKGVRAALALKFKTTPEVLFPEWARQRHAEELGEGLCDALEESARLLKELDGTAEAAGTAETAEEEVAEESSGTEGEAESGEEHMRRLAEAIEERSRAQARAYAEEEEKVY